MSMQVLPTESEIREIVETAVDDELDSFSMEGNFYEDYGMDSLGAISLVVEVQKRYKVRLPDKRMPDIRTGNQLVAAIQELQLACSGAQGAASDGGELESTAA